MVSFNSECTIVIYIYTASIVPAHETTSRNFYGAMLVLWIEFVQRVVWVPEWLALTTLVHKTPGLNPTEGGIQLMTVWCFIAQSLSLSLFHRLNMT